MPRQQIGKRCSGYIQEAVRFWLGLAEDDISSARWQLERIVDCVCDRHGVARNTAEQEIYKGLARLANASSSTASPPR
ncbi:MAG: hypothetical protein ACLPV8_08540 [Steroidobacteraceae bacterium]